MQDQIRHAQKFIGIIGRALLGAYFLGPGISKITGFSAMSDYMATHNVPMIPVLLVVTIILQIGGGAALIIDYRTQVVAFLLAGLTLGISLFMHDFWNDAAETQNFVKNMAIMGGLMFVASATLDHKQPNDEDV